MEIIENKFYTPQEAADILGLKRLTIIRKCKSGDISCANIGSEIRSNYRIKGEAMLDYLNN